MARSPRPSFEIGTVRVRPGRRQALSLPITRLVTGADVDLPVRVVHGREEGPTVWIDAAIHGDEAVGVKADQVVWRGGRDQADAWPTPTWPP